MAKRKTPKAKKSLKVSNEDLNILQKLVNDINKLHMQMGLLETQKHGLSHAVSELNSELLSLREKLKKDYGTDDINIVDGTINKNEIN